MPRRMLIRTYAHYGRWIKLAWGKVLRSYCGLGPLRRKARNLDKSDLHPGPDVLQGHRCIAEHDDGQWNEQLGASGSSAGGSSSGGAGAPPSIPNAPCDNGFPMDAWGDCN